MLHHVVEALACPHCGESVSLTDRSLICARGHTFDVARQGYVSLLPGGASTGTADTADMVAARARFLAAGHYAPIADAVAAEVLRARSSPEAGDVVVDVGAGTGHYLAHTLERLPDGNGVAMDISKYAARHAAKAHPRLGSVVADAWRRLPVRTAAAAVLMNVFAPRNAQEMHRVLRPGGHLVLVTPTPRHLAELVTALDLLSVDERKQQRLEGRFAGLFEPVRETGCEFTMRLGHDEIEQLAAMGPSAWHSRPDALRQRVAALPSPCTVTGSVTVSVHRRAERQPAEDSG